MSCCYVLEGHIDVVLCLDTFAISSEKTLIVTGSKNKTVRLWDAHNKRCIGVGRDHTGDIGAITFPNLPHSTFFVGGSSDLTLKIWNLGNLSDSNITDLEPTSCTTRHLKNITFVAIAPHDILVCSASEDYTACIWKLPHLTHVYTLKGHLREIWSVEFSPVHDFLITASQTK